ncbi:MAG: NAD(P)-binding domain-containing protein, partial [Betaproteobacteria bacterium]|nr:NAD(P)-binding domain-containing protein [Betaproteobacteria bacterium]
MSAGAAKLGWIGTGRMGYAMAERLAKAGCDLTVWNRTRAKAEPLAKQGAKIADTAAELAGCDIVFAIVATGADLIEVLEGAGGLLSGGGAPKVVVDSTSCSVEDSARARGARA